MKNLIIVSVFGLFGFMSPDKPNTDISLEKDCTLSATGYGDSSIGRIPMQISATRPTCEAAAEYLREQIIDLQFSIQE